jgi:O-acetyl-ADP-ribose deacetylase (regulator of RNase III)
MIARTTEAFGLLKCRFVIHAVGADYRTLSTLPEGDQIVSAAYRHALEEAQRVGASSVAFSLISAGVFRGERTLKEVLGLAVRACVDKDKKGNHVSFCTFTPQKQQVLEQQMLDELFSEMLANTWLSGKVRSVHDVF